MRVVVSACLMGESCRYDGGSKPCDAVRDVVGRMEPLLVCPECAGGLPVPRPPAERVGRRVMLRDGTDVTEAFKRGAGATLDRCRSFRAPLAILKAKSPSCGRGLIYDGTYTGRLTAGDGVFASLLEREGICVVSEDVVEACRPSVEHPVAIVVGTGLGHIKELVHPVRRIPYAEIPGFPADARTIEGHSYEAVVGTIEDVPVVVYPGRIHLYQGYSAPQVTSLVRHAHRLGCRDIIFVCATGAVEGNATPGIGIITDHINLTGHNPLDRPDNLSSVESPFVGMTDAYTPYLRTLAHGVADDKGIGVSEGVYAGLLGPSLETPAEVRALAALGVSYTGMALVNETIMAHALGMNVLALTLASNAAGSPDMTHESVLAAAEANRDDMDTLVSGVLRLL